MEAGTALIIAIISVAGYLFMPIVVMIAMLVMAIKLKPRTTCKCGHSCEVKK